MDYCWFCNTDEQRYDWCFDGEFDTWLHLSCLIKTLEENPDHIEAKLMSYLLDDDNDEGNKIKN